MVDEALACVHPLTETDVESIEVRWCSFVGFETDTDLKDDEITDLKSDVERMESEINSLEATADAANSEAAAARSALAESKDAKIVLDCGVRMERAERKAQDWKQLHDEAQQEMTALRRRKGVIPGYFKAQHSIMHFIHNAQQREWLVEHGAEAAHKLLKEIHTQKP